MKLGFKTFVISLALLSSSCLEPQPEPEITQIPSETFSIETVVSDLSYPWSVAELPSGDLLVTEKGDRKTGTMPRLLRISGNKKQAIEGLPEKIYTVQQGGLLDVSLDPEFADNNYIYLSYAEGTDAANGTQIYKARLEDNQLLDGKVIFKALPKKDTGPHFGGRLTFLVDDTLVLTLGDGFTYREAAQDRESHLGKIIRINSDGSVPSDNPFVGVGMFREEVYSYGHRNVQGIFFDTISGALWAHEHGPRGGDELNLIYKGKNYGWPLATTGVDYNGAKISPLTTAPETQAFVTDWTPSIAPSGLIVYRGDLFSEYQGDIFLGGLASRDLRRVDVEKGEVVSEESWLDDLDGRVRDVREARDGALLVLIDDPENGKLIRITPR